MNRVPDGMVSRRVRRWAAFASILVLVWLIVSFAVVHRLTRRARASFEERAPAVSWGRFESVRIATCDGEQIGGWFVQGSESKAGVLLLHGNGGSRGHCLDLAEDLVGLGYSVLMISLRAHGDSSGDFNDIGYSARWDVIAAVEELERRRPGRPVLIHGRSLGSAAAAFASGELGGRVRGYVLECPYRDLDTAVWNRTRESLPIGIDWIAYRGLRMVAPLVLDDIDAIAPIDAISGVPEDVPILILAGEDDQKSTPEDVRAIHGRVRSHAKLSMYKKAGHMKLRAVEPDRYRSEVLDFVSRSSRVQPPNTLENRSRE